MIMCLVKIMNIYVLMNNCLYVCMKCSAHSHIRMYMHVDIYVDIAIWVLNNQITKDKNDERIRYDYKLIDDFDHLSSRTRFHSLLHRNFRHSQSSVPTQSYTAIFHTTNQSCRLEHTNPTPEETENAKVKQPKYEPTNHILYVMVSL